MKYCLSIFLTTHFVVFLCCGCVYTQGTFDNAEKITQYQPLPLPIKFYVEDIELIKGTAGKAFYPDSEPKRWKNELLNHYPEIFSPTEENALKVKYSFYVSGRAENVSPAVPFFLLISLPTLGLLPIKNEFTMEANLITWIEGQRITQDTSLQLNARCNIGILGVLLPTRYLLSEQKGYLFTSENIGAGHDFTVPNHKMKLFLRLFVAQLYRQKPEQIWKLYTTKCSKSIKLLE